jgi:hypothetical protein
VDGDVDGEADGGSGGGRDGREDYLEVCHVSSVVSRQSSVGSRSVVQLRRRK